MADTALFVIDIQNELSTDPNTQVPQADRVNTAASSILDKVRSNQDGGPGLLIFVQHEDSPENGDLVRNTEPWKLVFPPKEEELASGRAWLVPKTTRDTFESNTDLAQRLRDRGIKKVVAFGLQSDFCVRSTSQGALNAGFHVTLLQGAHSTYDEGGKTAEEIERDVESELERQGAKIVPWEEWMATF